MKLDLLTISMLFLCIASAKADDTFSCPVTRAEPAPTGAVTGLVGNEQLSTIFPGNWQTTQKTERGFRIPKIVWRTTAFDLKQEVSKSSLTITGRRLDADSGPLQFGGASTAWIDEASRSGQPVLDAERTPVSQIDKDKFFITSEFYVPTLGCWEVTGHLHGTDLTIVVELK